MAASTIRLRSRLRLASELFAAPGFVGSDLARRGPNLNRVSTAFKYRCQFGFAETKRDGHEEQPRHRIDAGPRHGASVSRSQRLGDAGPQGVDMRAPVTRQDKAFGMANGVEGDFRPGDGAGLVNARGVADQAEREIPETVDVALVGAVARGRLCESGGIELHARIGRFRKNVELALVVIGGGGQRHARAFRDQPVRNPRYSSFSDHRDRGRRNAGARLQRPDLLGDPAADRTGRHRVGHGASRR